jgi:outer membrane immunogenic protein
LKLKLLAAASALTLLSSASAFAADVVVQNEPNFSWTGGYVGIQGGYGWTHAKFSQGPFFDKENFNGGLLGAHAGYNFQNGSFVYGIEGDISYNWNSKDIDGLGGLNVGTDWQGTLRGRVGYAVDRTLLYGTGGVAFTNGFIKIPFLGLKRTETFTGFTVGAGVEHAFTDNWTARLEYRYIDFGKKDVGGMFTGLDAKLKQQSVLVGVGYKF